MTHIVRSVLSVVACLSLAGCHGMGHHHLVPPHPQDSFQTRSSVSAQSMPDALPQTRMPSIDGRADSPAAYRAPAMPSFADRPLQENVEASIELADYAQVLRQTGIMPWLNANGPYTVFAFPNAALEKTIGQWQGGITASYNQSRLLELAQYSVVPGRWDEVALGKALRRSKAASLSLKTLSGQWIYIQPTVDGSFVVGNGRDPSVRVWGKSFPQANGVLYFLHGVVTPRGH
ncbi:fasciclin domain-containing protein [Neokomagataea tanensis]|nr:MULTISPECIES: fasciclin domain-containing protein [Neokomagataea]